MKKIYPVLSILLHSIKIFIMMLVLVLGITSITSKISLSICCFVIFIGLLTWTQVYLPKKRKKTTADGFASNHPIVKKMSKQIFIAFAIIQFAVLILATVLTWLYERPNSDDLQQSLEFCEVSDSTLAPLLIRSLPVPVQTYWTQSIVLIDDNYDALNSVLDDTADTQTLETVIEISTEIDSLTKAAKCQSVLLALLWIVVGALDYPAMMSIKYTQIKKFSGGESCS